MKKRIIVLALIMLLLLGGGAFLIKHFFFNSSENNQANVADNSNQVIANTVVNVSNNKPNPLRDEKVEKNPQLQLKANSLLNLFDNMPAVPVFIKDEPILKTGSDIERGLAYTICEEKIKPTIFIKKDFYDKGNQKQITNILKHELTHAWFCRKGVKVGHGEDFRKKFESIGGFGN